MTVAIGTDLKGRKALVALPIANTFRTVARYIERETGINLNRIIQAQGTYEKSGQTHVEGWSIDFRTRDLSDYTVAQIVGFLRECGYAAWHRKGKGWENNEHIHITANHKNNNAYWQIESLLSGYNGLTGKSRAKDNGPKLTRDLISGYNHAIRQMTKGETEVDAKELIDAFMAFPITANGKEAPLKQHLAELFVNTAAQSLAVVTERDRDRKYVEQLIAEIRSN